MWETPIADRTKGNYAETAGSIVINGKVMQGLDGCDRYGSEACYISAYDANTGKQLWKFHTIARGNEPGADTWGKLADNLRIGGETWITGSYDPDLNLTFWGTAQAKPWVPASRGMTVFDAALYQVVHARAESGHRKAGVALPAHSGRSARSGRSVRARARRYRRSQVRLLDRQGRRAVEAGSQDRRVRRAQGNDLPERLRSHRCDRPASRSTAPTSSKAKVDEWIQACPSTEGGHNWQAMSYNQPTGLLIIPLSQSCMEMQGRDIQKVDGSGGTGARAALLRNARHRTATSASWWPTTRATMKEVWSKRAARRLPHRVLSTASGVGFVGDLDRTFARSMFETGETLWQTRLGTSVSGLPVSFTAGGKQYIAVPTGLGGGSPRQVPRTITPDIKHPNNGNALYVFELPERR